jgi:Arc/MetJ-type ribon-helix-helix transcriptional regulator
LIRIYSDGKIDAGFDAFFGSLIMSRETIRTTVALPKSLLAAMDAAVESGKARSRNELLARAVERELASIQRAAIDAAFAGMAEDEEYQREAAAITAEFSSADWDAFRTGEAR